MNLQGKRVLVMGLGVSGAAAARLCLAKGASVVATDRAADPPAARGLEQPGLELRLGGHSPRDLAWAEIIVVSPGVDHRLPEIQDAVRRGAWLLGEMELGYRFLRAPAVMVTGTNGKTTVTTLIGEMLKEAGLAVFTGGNLGTPLCQLAAGPQAIDWAVLEVSSFQTDTADELRPRVGVMLNVTPDHLDRYDSFADYAASKFRLFSRQGGDDVAILCLDDPEVAARARLAPALAWGYAARGPRRPGGWLEDDDLVLDMGRGQTERLSAAMSPLRGGFNRLNLLAASLASRAAGAPLAAVRRAIEGFKGLGHRLQLVAEKNGVAFYDDSKGTNVGAVQAALAALDRPAILLLGGRDKEGRFADLEPQLGSAPHVICFGEAGPSIAAQLAGLVKAQVVADLAAAVGAAASQARPGQAVLLSPGCASFDAYGGYAQRGDHFQRLVRELP